VLRLADRSEGLILLSDNARMTALDMGYVEMSGTMARAPKHCA